MKKGSYKIGKHFFHVDNLIRKDEIYSIYKKGDKFFLITTYEGDFRDSEEITEGKLKTIPIMDGWNE